MLFKVAISTQWQSLTHKQRQDLAPENMARWKDDLHLEGLECRFTSTKVTNKKKQYLLKDNTFLGVWW